MKQAWGLKWAGDLWNKVTSMALERGWIGECTQKFENILVGRYMLRESSTET